MVGGEGEGGGERKRKRERGRWLVWAHRVEVYYYNE